MKPTDTCCWPTGAPSGFARLCAAIGHKLALLLLVSSLLCLASLQGPRRMVECKPAGTTTSAPPTELGYREATKEDKAAALKIAKQVCADKKVKVQSLSEMQNVILMVQLDDRICPDRFLSAIYELQPLLELPSKELCSEMAFDMMKDYHFRFIQPMKRANRRPTQFEAFPRDLVKAQLHPEPRKWTVEFDEHNQALMAPISFRHFFLKFALQVSHQCKRNLLDNLHEDTRRLLNDQDREIMQMFEPESPIGQALAGSDGLDKIDFDTVLHIPELDGRLLNEQGEEIKQTGGGKSQYLKTSAHEDSALFQMIYACKNRFAPLYDTLILPVVRLSKLGYDYQGKRGLSERERAFLSGHEMKTWLVIVHVCEIFRSTILVRSDSVAGEEQTPRPKSLRDQLNELDDDDDDDDTDGEGPTSEQATNDGKLAPMSAQEAKQLEQRARLEKVFVPLDYRPLVRNSLSDQLMIESERDLDWELSLKNGHTNPFGFKGFLRRLASTLKKALAKLDLLQFAHYRRHSLWYSGLLNFISCISNTSGITITVMALGGVAIGR